MELDDMENLIITPSFDGLRCLEKFRLSRCPDLEEIHASFGGLDRVVCLTIEKCPCIKRFPSITRLKKLETLSFARCRRLFRLSKIQQNMGNFGDEGISSAVWELSKLNKIGLCFFQRDLRKLDLTDCNLGDKDIGSAVWELPNLQELNLSVNKFSRLSFSLIRTPRLKLLNVSWCDGLVELSGLPTNIAVLKTMGCYSLKTIGDVSNCRWLWKVSLRGTYHLRPHHVYTLLESMLKGKAIEDHHISVSLENKIQKEIVGRLRRGNTFTLYLLQRDWYNAFYGFLIHVVTYDGYPEIDIIMKQEAEEGSRVELRQQESNEEVEPEDDGTRTYVGYVSFNILRRTARLNPAYNYEISISLRQSRHNSSAADRIGAALVPRKTKDDPLQTTDYSEFWDEADSYRPTFTMEHDSKSSINILWQPS